MDIHYQHEEQNAVAVPPRETSAPKWDALMLFQPRCPRKINTTMSATGRLPFDDRRQGTRRWLAFGASPTPTPCDAQLQ